MATKSTNTQGNPYHDESTGEFTSADGVGTKESDIDAKNNLSQQNTPSPSVKSFKFKFKGNIDEIKNDLHKSHQVASIPFLMSSRDIEEHLEEFFPPEIVKSIDSQFGMFSVPYKYFNLRTDPKQRCGVNIFHACIGKKRWKNNYIRLIDKSQYDSLSGQYGFLKVYRGLTSDTFEDCKTIADSYSSKENEMIYGSSGGTCYGIAFYSSTYREEAVNYAYGAKNQVMDLVLDKNNSKTMSYNSICRIRNNLAANKDSIVARVEKIFLDNGIESSKAKQMARSFGITMNDEGFVAMLCGVEWYNNGDTYNMIENIGRLYRWRKDDSEWRL